MGYFAELTANLKLNTQSFSTSLRSAAAQTESLSKTMKGQLASGLSVPAKKAGVEFKDVARIVQGIIISKVFYAGLNAIRKCVDSVWEFSKQLEYAQIAYTNLFSSQSLATEFINVLKDFAAVTPFSFQESEAAAKRLLAYGVQYKNVMYMMKGILAASSMQGNPQVIESVSRALGQIYTKGRLMNEEMRQLAEAGIPAYEILKDKLGLTQQQLQRLGKEGIPASRAINALIDGMTERFGGVVAASSKTITGIMSNIKDNALMLTSGAVEPLVNKIKSGLDALGTFLFKMREIQATKGNGGVLEALVPKELQPAIRGFIANIMLVHQASTRLIAAMAKFAIPVLKALLATYNAFAPIVISVSNALSYLLDVISSNSTAMKILTSLIAAAAAMWVMFRLKAMATAIVTGVISAISKALLVMSSILTFVVAHPFWALMLALGGTVVGLSIGFGKLSDAIGGFFRRLTGFSGIDPDKLLLPSQKERANDLSKFNNALDGTKDSMDDLADSTGKATKAAKGLLSFDEVFKLTSPDETSKGGGISSDNDFTAPDLSGLGGDAFIPKIPDFGNFAKNSIESLISKFKEKLKAAGIGAILGGLLGGIIGGPLGAKIGIVAGTIAGWLWDGIADKLGLSEVAKVSIPFAGVLGTAIGFVAGGPLGAGIGLAIGALVGWLIDSISYAIETDDWTKISTPVGIGLGAALGFVIGGPVGAGVGAAIGGLVGWLIDSIGSAIMTGDWKKPAAPLAIGICGIIGFIIGGPLGAAIGAAIGALVTWLVSLLVKNWDKVTAWFNNLFKEFTLLLLKATVALVSWVDELWDKSFSRLFGWLADGIGALKEFFGLSGSAPEFKEAPSKTKKPKTGHAYGGIFDKEHIARFAEGNKREAVIPLENKNGMQPFVDAVANGITASLMPIVANISGGQSQLQPLYVGTLIADERSLKELQRKMSVIQMEEDNRRTT